ncbi:MAG TPA: fumarylacetoacetate hydrolase family protein [Mycobacterium sp.]|nr:fumarylacetoacetate hydrolase family protein [Mycobacterium sp.]
MKLALFDKYRLGLVEGDNVVDVTSGLPWPHDEDPVTAGWWRRLCRDFDGVREGIEEAARRGVRQPLSGVRLQAPVLNPSKIIAAASNYAAHVAEMHGVQERTLGRVESWMMNFDVFLKAPSAISGPADDIVLPRAVLDAGDEIHHESELLLIIGKGGKDIAPAEALDHVFGYSLGLDITVRSAADRSRRKSYDTFSPIGPWITVADQAVDPTAFEIGLAVNGVQRQNVTTADLITPVPEIISYASSVMSLLPGDVIFTGAPPGVGPIRPGDQVVAQISGIGGMRLSVRAGA